MNSSYEEKYKKALKSIEEIIKANKQIKDELDTLRAMRQAQLESFANIQKQEFKKAYDALLKEKGNEIIKNQTLELENQKLKYTIAELEHQISLYRAERSETRAPRDERETINSNQEQPSPRKLDNRDASALLREKEAEFHRTLQNYEQHHLNLQRNAKRLQERIGELETKLSSCDKNWRIKYEAKELEVIDIKAQARQEFTEQIAILRKENAALKINNSELALRLENTDRGQAVRGVPGGEWEGELLQEMIAVKASMEPLRQQICELQELNLYEREQSVRERTNLQTRVLELQAQGERLQETLKNMQKKAIEAHQQKVALAEKAEQLKRIEEENQLLNGRIIVMQSRQIALRNRTGEQLEERVLEFQNRIQLLLNNKEGLRELREVGIHQLLALKAYIMQLDSRLKELILNNNYLLKKYKSYKEKYQSSLKEQKQLGLTINTLKMKILGYDKLVLKLQGELERLMRINEADSTPNIIINKSLQDSSQIQLYRRKYQLMREKLETQEKYKQQELETFKLSYQTKIMELTIKVEDARSLKETIDLYRAKNEQLQGLLSRKETELFQSKILTNSKAGISASKAATENQPRQSKEIINQLHASIKQSDETIFRLQAELRSKQDTHKRAMSKLERQLEELREDHARELSKREMDYAISLDQEVKKYKLKISDLQHTQLLQALTHKDEHHKKNEEAGDKVRKLQARVQEAEAKREEEVFNRRRIEKQLLDLTHDKEQAQRTINDLQLKLTQFKYQEKEYIELKNKTVIRVDPRDNQLDYQLQSKDAIIKRLNSELLQLKSSLGGIGERDITISSQKNQIYYLKKEVEELNDTINKYNNEIVFLKGTLDTNKTSLSTEVTSLLEDKENALTRLRRDISSRDTRIRQLEEEASRLDETLRKYKRDLSEVDRLKEEVESLMIQLQEKDRLIQRLRQSENGWDEEVDRLGKELVYVKENFQKVSYQLLQKDDQISKLNLQLNAATLRTREQLEVQYSEELIEKERQCSRLNSELLTLKSTLAIAQDDRNYHEENTKRVNSDLLALRSQLSQLQDQHDELQNQLYFKNQQINKLQFTIQGYRQQEEEISSRNDQTYRMRTEIFSLKSDISNLQEEVFNRQANNARLANEIAYVRNQYAELEEELTNRQQLISKLTFQYNSLKENYEEAIGQTEERQRTTTRAKTELLSAHNKYRELQEEMEEREQTFSMLNQEIARLKTNLTYYQEEIDERNTQIARGNNQRQILKAEIVRLTQVITEKNQEVNRAKQQVFALRLQAGERDYGQKMRIDQEIYSLKSKISSLEHQVEDRDSQIRRLQIDLDSVRSQPAPQSTISEEEVQELRSELGKRQRQLINMRYDLQDRQYQLQTMTNNANMLRNTLNQYQQRLVQERQQYESDIKEYVQRERKWQEQINTLHEELEQKSYQPTTVTRPISFENTYTEEEVAALREQNTIKQRELNSIKYELEDKNILLQSTQSKTKMQETLLRQIQEQYNEDRLRYQAQIQQYITQERLYQRNIEEIQEHYQQRIAKIQYEKLQISKASANLTTTPTIVNTTTHQDFDEQALVGPYMNEIDRLNQIIQEQQYQLQSLSLRIQQLEIVQVQTHQQQTIGQNTTQTTALRQQHQTQTTTELREQQVQINLQDHHEEQVHQEQAQHSQGQEEGSSENEEHVVEEKHVVENDIKGSLIQQLQKEQSISEGSQVRGGQIMIKIQNPQQYVATSAPIYNQRAIQVQPQQPQFIQGPNGQPIRVIQKVQQIQQVPQQVFILPQQPAPYPPQNVIIQNGQAVQSAVYQAAVPQPIPVARNYISMAAPVNVQPYRSLP